MTGAFYVIIQFVTIFLDFILLAMLIRALLSWFTMGNNGGWLVAIANFLYVVTEPFIMPLRQLFARFRWFQGVPLDMPYLITTVILGFVNMLLGGMLA